MWGEILLSGTVIISIICVIVEDFRRHKFKK